MKSIALESVSPVFAVDGLSQALDFYQRVLGFDLAWSWGSPSSKAAVCRDSVEIILALRPDARPPGPSKIYMRVSGIDAYYAQIEGAGGKIIVPIGDRLYGMRDFRVVDPSGNELDIAQATT